MLTTEESLREVFGTTLADLVDEFPNILVLDGDLANSTRADIFAERRPERFLEMGIAEQNLMGAAAGLATVGFIPFISTFAAFAVKRAADQVRVVVAQPHLNVKIIGSYAGILTGKTGKTHQSVEDLALMRAMPGMTVVAPADGPELRGVLRAACLYDGPMYIRVTRDPSPVIFDSSYQFAVGPAVQLADGPDISIISTGVQTTRALEAVRLLAAEGIRAGLLHVPTLKPLDTDAIVAAARRTGRVVTAEDHTIIGGLGGAVAETLGEQFPVPVHRVGVRDVFGESGPDAALLEKYGLTGRHVAQAAREMLGR
ncbi:MAG TPA: transketolase C-terminal domain-containing protein [Chloroflexia bacterium]|nr:transketolase C-terminal domain-containing protein [Chloroflexia bacterium]